MRSLPYNIDVRKIGLAMKGAERKQNISALKHTRTLHQPSMSVSELLGASNREQNEFIYNRRPTTGED